MIANASAGPEQIDGLFGVCLCDGRNLILDEHGGPNHVGNDCDAAVLINTTSHELFTHPQYWYIGHFSKFVPPGSFRLATTVSVPGREDRTQEAGDDCRGWPYCTCN